MNDQRDDGMEPNEVGKFKFAKEGSPDEPNAPDAAGHMPRNFATEKSPDEPGGDDTEGHRRKFHVAPTGEEDTEGHGRGRSATEPAPDEPGAGEPRATP